MTMPRRIEPEALDHLAPEDPAAQRSRRDLMRVHRAMGSAALVARGWRGLWAPRPDRAGSLSVLELGAGDGTLLLRAARELGTDWPSVELSLMDRQNIVRQATMDAYERAGWYASVHAMDVMDWAAPGMPSPRWDLITTSLFLHHFDDMQLQTLLTAIAARCDRFFALEPRRAWPALAGSHLVGALGANAVTRQDAVLSVHAGFREREISALWPHTGVSWQTREGPAGLFSHSFSAWRTSTR
jgi:hypothetical protein